MLSHALRDASIAARPVFGICAPETQSPFLRGARLPTPNRGPHGKSDTTSIAWRGAGGAAGRGRRERIMRRGVIASTLCAVLGFAFAAPDGAHAGDAACVRAAGKVICGRA